MLTCQKDVYPGAGRRLVFDVAQINQGSGYNSHTGVFTCPKTGIYVFVWVICLYSGEHSTELMINNSVYGSTFLRAKVKYADEGSVSGTVVAQVSKGDTIYVRNNPAYVPEMVEYTVTFKLNQHFRVGYYSRLHLFYTLKCALAGYHKFFFFSNLTDTNWCHIVK
ncbi:COL8A [Mytilus coruscus]|uniref:COL8A n=1 Tax=Mytilus coruscus TaxID=42192 RepID=A0A6J8CDM9_MYTCO|nr:COL8A [Mytilus coruscus]